MLLLSVYHVHVADINWQHDNIMGVTLYFKKTIGYMGTSLKWRAGVDVKKSRKQPNEINKTVEFKLSADQSAMTDRV